MLQLIHILVVLKACQLVQAVKQNQSTVVMNIAHAISEHQPLVAAAGAQDLVREGGFRFVFRTARALDEALAEYARRQRRFGGRGTGAPGTHSAGGSGTGRAADTAPRGAAS